MKNNLFEGMSEASIRHSEDSYIKAELVGLEREAVEAVNKGDIESLDVISGYSDAGTELVESVKAAAEMELNLREKIG